MKSKEGDDGMTNSGWRLLKGLTNVKKKHWRKSTSVLRLDWSSVLARVFFTQIGSLFGNFFDFFCLHRFRVGPLFEAISVCVRIRVPLRYCDDMAPLLQSNTLAISSYSAIIQLQLWTSKHTKFITQEHEFSWKKLKSDLNPDGQNKPKNGLFRKFPQGFTWAKFFGQIYEGQADWPTTRPHPRCVENCLDQHHCPLWQLVVLFLFFDSPCSTPTAACCSCTINSEMALSGSMTQGPWFLRPVKFIFLLCWVSERQFVNFIVGQPLSNFFKIFGEQTQLIEIYLKMNFSRFYQHFSQVPTSWMTFFSKVQISKFWLYKSMNWVQASMWKGYSQGLGTWHTFHNWVTKFSVFACPQLYIYANSTQHWWDTINMWWIPTLVSVWLPSFWRSSPHLHTLSLLYVPMYLINAGPQDLLFNHSWHLFSHTGMLPHYYLYCSGARQSLFYHGILPPVPGPTHHLVSSP